MVKISDIYGVYKMMLRVSFKKETKALWSIYGKYG